MAAFDSHSLLQLPHPTLERKGVTAGPSPQWLDTAKQDADVVFTTKHHREPCWTSGKWHLLEALGPDDLRTCGEHPIRALSPHLSLAMLEAKVLLEYMTDAVVDLDDQLYIRAVNGRAALLYRRSADQLVGRAFGDLFPEFRTSGVLDQLLAARAGKIPRKLEIFIPSLFFMERGFSRTAA